MPRVPFYAETTVREDRSPWGGCDPAVVEEKIDAIAQELGVKRAVSERYRHLGRRLGAAEKAVRLYLLGICFEETCSAQATREGLHRGSVWRLRKQGERLVGEWREQDQETKNPREDF